MEKSKVQAPVATSTTCVRTSSVVIVLRVVLVLMLMLMKIKPWFLGVKLSKRLYPPFCLVSEPETGMMRMLVFLVGQDNDELDNENHQCMISNLKCGLSPSPPSWSSSSPSPSTFTIIPITTIRMRILYRGNDFLDGSARGLLPTGPVDHATPQVPGSG